ncbi:peptidase inhibitor family I36 protein [Amycolatopsis sp. NPDC024027]|uniref:peptidase inhibitor family I36 protein n=1 Tax=Amycolatopsis sp. NPDC024027 TaxID=3154327 RepID=UPI0033F2E805
MKRAILALTIASLGAGVGITGATPADAAPAAYCASGNICVYNGFNFTGSTTPSWKCGVIDNIGSRWGSDQVRSFINNQTGHVVATFYNWNGSNWIPIGYSQAYDSRPYAPASFYNVPDGVDGIKPC